MRKAACTHAACKIFFIFSARVPILLRIFAFGEDRMRFGKNHLKTSFSFVFALTFRYLCHVPSPMPLSMGRMERELHILERRLSGALFLAHQNLANSKSCSGQGNGRCPVGMFYSNPWRACMVQCGMQGRSIYTYRRGLLRCSFNCTGQCEGLYAWDGQQVQTPALFLYMHIT